MPGRYDARKASARLIGAPTRIRQLRIDRRLERLRGDAAVGLHLGCGSHRIANMINCDLYSNEADRRVDSLDLVDFEDATVDLIEHHHMLEHLSAAEADRGFREWHRVLKPGGHLVVSCPDFDVLARRWTKASHEERWSSLIEMVYGSQEREGMFHRSGYNRRRLEELMRRHGFQPGFAFRPYPARPTPSLLVIARKPERTAR